jgi:hypothetical protein
LGEWLLRVVGLADAEVGSAAAVDPEATTIDSPGAVADAG